MIAGLDRLRAALADLDTDSAARVALSSRASMIADAVRESLNHAPGSDHATPWRQTGTLHDSIAVTVTDNGAVVGSSDPVAVDQELGTRTDPPRPFLAPAAAEAAPALAEAVGVAVADALREAMR